MNLVKFTKDSTLQRIKASYIQEEFELTPHEEEIKKRLVHFHSLVFDRNYSKHQAIKIHCREMGVSKATAYRDAQQTEYIMGNVMKVNVDFQRAMLMENYYNLYQTALKKGNLEAAKSALDSYKSLINFNEEESTVNPEKLEASDYIVKLHKAARDMFKKNFDKGVLDLNDVDVEDIEHKEVMEDDA